MRVLIACEFSGRVRDAFRANGHDAISCDLLDSESPGPHIRGDVRDHLGDGWDLLVAHPPCTYLTVAGAQYWQARAPEQREAAQFVLDLWRAPVERVCIENPQGALSRLWRKPSQVIHPYLFGDPYCKRTHLWLRGLDPLVPTYRCANPDGRWYYRFSSRNASMGRSRTFPGIAAAMGSQWGGRPVQLSLSAGAFAPGLVAAGGER